MTQEAGSKQQYPFPSRKDVHGTRIPKTTSGDGPTPPQVAEQSLREALAPKAATQVRRKPAPATGPVPVVKPLRANRATEPQSPEMSSQTTAAAQTSAPVMPSAPVTPSAPVVSPQPVAPAVQVPPVPQTPVVVPGASQPVQPAPAAPNTAQAARQVGRPDLGSSRASQPQVDAAEVASRRRKRKRRKTIRTTIALTLLLALVVGAVWFAIGALQTETIEAESDDYPGPGTGSVEVLVEPGDTGGDIANTLYEAGVVKTPAAFIRAFENNSAAASLQPGTYSLKLEMSGAGALAAMLDDTNRQDNAFTVNAGQTVAQVSERLANVAGFDPEQIQEALDDPTALGLPEVANGNAEGWFAEGSYEIASGDTVSEVLAAMVAKQVATLESLEVEEDLWEEVLTKASILEREAGSVEDMARIARVVQNRLDFPDAETQGLLQMDSTALYGVGKSGGLPTSEELADDNPYNTYVQKGLPPSPIGTPSTSAIEAVLEPADGDWLYFVTVDLDTGETLFAVTYEEQVSNVEKLRQWCEANEDRC